MSQERQSRLSMLAEFYQRQIELAQSHYSPLLADGIDTFTEQTAHWTYPDGRRVPMSNFASQQNFLRGLIGLSVITGKAEYRDVAESITRYFLENYVDAKSGLFHWGGHRFVNLDSGEIEGPESKASVHELKHHFPYYDLLHRVSPEITEKYLQGFWAAHVLNWDQLDLSRHGEYGKAIPSDLFQSHQPQPVVDPVKLPNLPETVGLTFVNASTDLIYAACHYAKYSGDSSATLWAKHLYRQFVLARNPKTGMPVYQFSSPKQREPVPDDDTLTFSWFGDRAKRQFGPEFGSVALEANALFRDCWPVVVDNPLAIIECVKQLNDKEMMEWVIAGVKSYFNCAWDKTTNEIIPMWNDGTDLSGYTLVRDGYYGPKGLVLNRKPTDPAYLLPLVRASLLCSDPDLAHITVSMFSAFRLGELDPQTFQPLTLATSSDLCSPYLLFALLDLHQFTQNMSFLALADVIADNLVAKHFHRGFFIETDKHQFARLDNPIPYALLALEASYKGMYEQLPVSISTGGYLHGEMMLDGKLQVVFDRDVIYQERQSGHGIGL
jgi:pectate disaccharide-lyase